MQLSHQQLGVAGDRGTSDKIRIEFAVLPDRPRTEFVQLHDDGIGTFARVYRGQLRQGAFLIPVAIKVQRDASLTQEQSRSVAAKFDTERAVYLRVQQEDDTAGPGGGVVRYYDLCADRGSPVAPSAPPSILCPHARHALAPRCPRCAAALEPDRWAPSDDERSLSCPDCGRRFPGTPERMAELTLAAARKDPACAGCEQPDAVCRGSARFLNFFPARVLVFELMDIDLEDFLLASRAGTQAEKHRRFWDGWDAVRGGKGAPADGGLDDLFVIFSQVARGLRRLHSLGIAHLDLKPRNVCLTADGGRPQVRVIDLGFATDPHTIEYLRQVQGNRKLETDQAAPEVRQPASAPLPAVWRQEGGRHHLLVRPRPLGSDDPFDPLVIPGEAAEVWPRAEPDALPCRVLVERVAGPADALVLTVAWHDRSPPAAQLMLTLHKQAGPAADFYSLGMVLLGLLTGETQLQPVRDALPVWFSECCDLKLETAPSNRQLVELLRVRPSRSLDLFRKLADRMARFGAARPVAEELLGVALRLLFREPGGRLRTYLRHRTDDAAGAWRGLDVDLQVVARQLEAVRARSQAEGDRDWLAARVGQVRKKLEALPPRPPAKGVTIPAFERDRIERALRGASCGGGDPLDASVRELLAHYGSNPAWLLDHLGRFERPDEGAGGTELELDQRALVEVLRLAMPVDHQSSVLRKLEKVHARVAEALGQKGRRDQVRQRLETLATAAGALVVQVEQFDAALQAVDWYFCRLRHLFQKPLERERAADRPRPIRYTLAHGFRRELGDEAAAAGLETVAGLVASASKLQQRLHKRWAAALAEWESVPRHLRAALAAHAALAQQREKELDQLIGEWRAQAERAVSQLRYYLQEVKAQVLNPWDRRARPGRSARLTLRVEHLELAERYDPAAAVGQLESLHLGPAAFTQAALLLDEARVIQGLTQREEPAT